MDLDGFNGFSNILILLPLHFVICYSLLLYFFCTEYLQIIYYQKSSWMGVSIAVMKYSYDIGK